MPRLTRVGPIETNTIVDAHRACSGDACVVPKHHVGEHNEDRGEQEQDHWELSALAIFLVREACGEKRMLDIFLAHVDP